jgi:MoaA/NifB/PqqE/SkfB family radical SAM enzyme
VTSALDPAVVPRALGRVVRLGVAMALGAPLPFSVTFILTNRCNLRCAYCNIPERAADEMSERDFCRAIDELADAGLARAGFSGGEALLRPDALAIIAHAKRRGLATTLNSNAWFARDRIAEIAAVVDLLVLSVDGPEEVHDLVRRRRGSYARVVETLEAARARGLRTATITVVSRANADVVDDVLALAARHGAWAYFQPAYDDCFDAAAGLDPAIGPTVLADLAARLDRAAASGARVASSASFRRRLARGPRFGDCATCHAGRYFGTVLPDGTVIPCHLKSAEAPRQNGLEIGFARAFREMKRPASGDGCAISPYQEADLIFGLDGGAIRAALARLVG